MKIAVIGASGKLGVEVLREALARGAAVTGLCRNPAAVPPANGLTLKSVDLYDRHAFAAALQGHDAVVSCYSPGHNFDPARNIYLEVIEAVARIVQAVKATPQQRLLFVGGAASLHDESGRPLVDAPGYPEMMFPKFPPAFLEWLSSLPQLPYDPNEAPKGGAYLGGPDYAVALARAYMFFEHDRTYDWSFFSPPPAMIPGPLRGGYVTGGEQMPMTGGCYATISYADAGAAIMDEIQLRRQTWRHWTAYYPGD